MNLKKSCILIIFCVMIFSVGLVSASELDENLNLENDFNSAESIDLVENDDIQEDINSNVLSEDNSCVVYVDEKGDNNLANGTKENPFTTLDSACMSVNEYRNEVTVNISDGTYKIGGELKFNTSVLNINGMGSNVILKNLYDTSTAKQSFGLIESNNGKFSMTNIIFDASDWNQKNSKARCFSPFNNGDNNQVNFNNCTFTGFNGNNVILPHSNDELNNYNNYTFTNCKFINFTNNMHMGNAIKCDVSFINCIFSAKFENGLGMEESNNVTFDRCWFGYNDFNDNRMFTNLNTISGEITPRYGMSTGLYKFTKYAIFAISENYLGDNKYEIIGKLMWNDTTTDDIDKLGVMTVYLNSTTGVLNQTTAILENGIFKVLYTSTSSNNTISAVLDNQKIDLNFTSIDMSLNAPNFVYGDNNQNITITLSQTVYGAVTVIVNGIKYGGNIENNTSIVIPITNALPAGIHKVNVTFVDEENHIYAYNTTTMTVSKVSEYDFNATVNPTSVYIGDNVTIGLILPQDANGTVSVKVGNNEAKSFNANETIIVNGFVCGDNVVNITYNGNENYNARSIVKNVFASVKPTTINASDVSTTYDVAKDLIITLKDMRDKVLVNKTVNIVVGTINMNLTTDANGQASVDVSKLAPNTYKAIITFSGDDACAGSNCSANVVVNKIASKITAPAVTTTYNVAKNLVITLKDEGNVLSNQEVTVKVGTISTTLKTNAKGQISVDVSKLAPNTYKATITYKGDSIYAGTSGSAKVVVNKATPKITAKKATFKVKTKTKKYSITLKDNKGKALPKVKVTLKVKGKTYKATTNAKGKATFKITKLNKKGNYNAVIKFAGNSNYKTVSKKAKLTIKK